MKNTALQQNREIRVKLWIYKSAEMPVVGEGTSYC
jgi:hypothetical protein